jgi:hypothetical protein
VDSILADGRRHPLHLAVSAFGEFKSLSVNEEN